MKTKKQGLQKLTVSEKKINSLLAKKKIMPGDSSKLLNSKERDIFNKILANKLADSKGEELDKLLEQLSEVLPNEVKNQLWENNHFSITQSMTKLIEEYGKMPTKNQIAIDTGLSRQTIHKHLSGYAEHPLYAEQLKQFKFMADRVLAKVIKQAAQGDMKAARLYFEVMGNLGNEGRLISTIKTQNNYIQINQTKLSQETIKNLSPEQLNQIEAVLQSVSTMLPTST
jgi:hypothetical protein